MSSGAESDELARLLLRELAARTAAETAQQRFAFLANASTVLAASLDSETTLRTVARLAVPALADACAVHLVDEHGALRLAAVTHVDSRTEDLLRDLGRRAPPPDSRSPVVQTLHTGRSHLLSDPTAFALDPTATDPWLREVLVVLAPISTMHVALVARGRVLGVLTLAASTSRRRFQEDDLRLAEDLARRCALAVDSARLFAEAREAAARAEREHALLETFLAAAPVAIGFLDRDLRYVHINEALAHLNGAPVEAHLGRTVREMLPAIDPRIDRRLRQVLETGEPVMNLEVTPDMPGSDGRHWLVCYYPVRTPNGGVIGVGGILRDVTAQREIEAARERMLRVEQQARQEAEAANRAKDTFLAILSHELRTPLTPILAWVDMLRRGGLEPGVARRAIETMGRNARALARLIRDLLDFSRLTAGKLHLDRRPIDVTEVIGHVIDTLRVAVDAKMIQLRFRRSGTIDVVYADPDRLAQVVANLLDNAIKFTPAGGHIDVALANTGDGVSLTVADTGEGITPDLVPHVFESFRQGDDAATRPHGGLGLGLAIVRELVEAHGGRVAAASGGPGRGAVFTVHLPLDTRAPATASAG